MKTLLQTEYEKGRADVIAELAESKIEEKPIWTIQDAKDGDVLQSSDCTFVFKEIKDGWIYCYCMYHRDGSFVPATYALITLDYGHEVSPATFIECKKLEKAIKDAGYAWDVYTKKLIKVNKEQ